ncbi:DUF4297 domain-containing protein [Anabaena sphaerica FACHB-251]|uniref:DUF4297 domain-containing protein n=1 Tax=Anabaena sphaerica FACHB-251 TaxID=2692883 RepID=A0A926WDM1_9NOST|nr:dsDNA nuclease domain-containing protein [Anabaena sphaerica]MBD2291974.1 DUF4297 domain-containing protein [Anabaena sphaerica FACHB-251]
MNKSKTPADLISQDRGDDTLRRFRYQITYAAILSLSLLDDKNEISAIYCEHHEDIELETVDGKFIGIQVKTKEKEQHPFKSYDDQVIKSIRRFIQHELKYPDKFEKYIIAANCGFWDETDNKNNLKYLLSLTQKVDIYNLDIDKDLKNWFNDKLNNETDVKTIIKVFKKIELRKTPGLDSIDDSLLNSLSKYFEKSKTILHKQVTDIKDKLILKCFNASSLVLPPEAEYYYLFSNQSYQKSNIEIESKKITKTTLEAIINAVNESSKQEFSDTLLPVKFDEDFNTNNYSCNPEHFVGRDREKKHFWDFIDNIRKGKAEKHLICFEGNYGMGKSSLILKLQSESNSKNVFFEQFDTKITKTEHFDFGYVAIKKAIYNAIDKKFIDLPPSIYDEIEPAEYSLFLRQPAIKKVLNYLNENDKVIVIFFDHFDHLLRQPSRESTFDFFEQLIHEFAYDKTSIVLGFSWTSAISLGLDPNIRFRWEKLITDKMELVTISQLLDEEPKNCIEIFKKWLKEKRNKSQELKKIQQLEDWILNKYSAFPWLLRRLLTKFCNPPLDSNFPIKTQDIHKLVINMLESDLKKNLQLRERQCLEKIANFESNILESYEKEIQVLIEKNLIIESDTEYIVRDDILREYILNKDITLPDLSITYIPKRPVDSILKVFRLLETEITKEQLINKLLEHNLIKTENKSQSRNKRNKNNTKPENIDNVNNIISDLRHFFQVEYDTKTKSIKIKKDLLDKDDNEISDYLREQLEEHLVIKEICKNKHKIKTGKYFKKDMLKDLLKTLYSSESEDEYEDIELPLLTISTKKKVQKRDKFDHYTSRLLSWFRFAGIIERKIEQDEDSILLIPTNRPGKEKGKIKKEETTEDAKHQQLELL